MKLADIKNIKIDSNARKLSNSLYEFVACFLCDYALNYLHYNESDNSIYPYIEKYIVAGEITAKKLIEKMSTISEIEPVLSVFPNILKSRGYSYQSWSDFLCQCSWSHLDGINIFTFGESEYRIPEGILSLYSSGNDYFAQRYYSNSSNSSYYQNIGNGENRREIQTANILEGTKSFNIGNNDTNALFTVTDEDFFDLCEAIKAADDEQRSAIRSDIDKNLVILAGAGSGKTRTLVCRLAYLHLVKQIPLDKILLLTFTTSAASEMRQRSLDFIEPLYTKYHINDAPVVNARTIDSFIIGLIDTYYPQLGFENRPVKFLEDNLETLNNKIAIIDEIIRENRLQGVFRYYYDSQTGEPSDNIKWLVKNLMDYACGLPINAAGFDTLLQLYLEKQRDRGIILGFTEASLFVRDALAQEGSQLQTIIENRFDCILIDEFQDVSVLQNSIFKHFYDGKINFTFVGDDDQSIYYWRGSDNSIIRGLLHEQTVKACYLLTNYRNNPNIVNAGNNVLDTIKDRAKATKPIKPYRKTGSRIRVTEYDDKFQNLTAEVLRLIDEGIPANEICVLSRNKEDAESIAHAFLSSNIAVRIPREKYELNTIYFLMKSIICILNNTDVTKSIKEIQRITETEHRTERYVQKVICGDNNLYEVDDRLKNTRFLSDEIRLSSVTSLSNAVNRFVIKAQELVEDVDESDSLFDVFRAFEMFCDNHNAGWPVSQLQLKGLFSSFEKDHAKTGHKTSNSSEIGVQVSTIHAAKGLEYNVVMITGLSDGLYPNTSSIDRVYTARNAQLQTLIGARETYKSLCGTVHRNDIDKIISSCDNPEFSPKEVELLEAFKDEVYSNLADLQMLSADGVEEYLDSYRYYITPLEAQYATDVYEMKRKLLQCQTEYESLQDDIYLSTQDDSYIVETKRNDLNIVQQNISKIERKIERVVQRFKIFEENIKPIKQFYNICVSADGLIADIEKSDELEVLKSELEKEREQRINEERRLFYVAITRARDILYLCRTFGSRPSEFINLIDKKLTSNYSMLTVREHDELNRLTRTLHSEIEKSEVNDDVINEVTEELFSQDKFKNYIQVRTKEFGDLHPIFNNLSGEALDFYKKAVGMLFIQEMIGGAFNTEFAHNMQRMAEVVLSEYAGSNALPFKSTINNLNIVSKIVDDIRAITNKCLTERPSPSYVTKLFTEDDKYNDNLRTLKSSGIFHYVIRSEKYKIDKHVKQSWNKSNRLSNSNAFLIATIDLANFRNALVHDKLRDGWPEDPIPMIIKCAEIIVKECLEQNEKDRNM